jgi:hypothetical protein
VVEGRRRGGGGVTSGAWEATAWATFVAGESGIGEAAAWVEAAKREPSSPRRSTPLIPDPAGVAERRGRWWDGGRSRSP